ncbi:MAG: hypothetical protein Kow0099_29720 [Candidatus Abyssubacteria bacterium]
MKMFIFVFVFFFLSLCPPCWATETESAPETEALKSQIQELKDALEQFQRQHNEEVEALKQQLRDLSNELKKQRRLDEEEPLLYEDLYEPMPPVFEALPTGRGLWQSFNPDISVIGDVLAQYTSHENEGDRPDDQFSFRELEINFSGVLDPFARADAVVTVHEEFHEHEEEEHEHVHEGPRGEGHEHNFAIHIEEAYLTALALPHGVQARAGRMRERFGKINTTHLHALPWVDYPLFIKNYFGDEGLMADGAELSWLAPTRHYLELVYAVFNNDNNPSFGGEEFDDFVHLARAKSLFELSHAATLELGGSLATGPNDSGHGGSRTWLEGIDLTVKWLPPREALYRGLTWQTELLFSQKDTEDRGEQDTWGMYSSLEYKFARRWKAAIRYDYSEFPDFENFHEDAYSAYLTFAQSEFVFWRFGYMFVDRNFADPVEEDEHLVWLQLNFGLGPHRAHEY